MNTEDIRSELIRLERELHSPAARRNEARLGELLHPDFTEFGRSGRVYDFATVVALLLGETQAPLVHSQDFEVRLLAADTALLLYRSAHVGSGARLERHTLRASIWRWTPGGWQVTFHQGTPTEAFARDTT